MKTIRVSGPLPSLGAVLAVTGLQFLSAMFPSASALANSKNFFDWENLQSDIPGVADRTDSNLRNPWGLALNTTFNIFWVADNATGVSTLYQPDGTAVPLVVTIPPTPAENPLLPSAPTGIVFNTFAHAFKLPNGIQAAFIFDGEDGRITAWNGGLRAVIEKDNSPSGAVYKGLALAVRGNGEPTLYATNFHSGKIDVFDSQFQPVTLTGNFTDTMSKPPLPPNAVGWAPFGIASIHNLLYITFAAQNAALHDDVAGPGAGFVDVFDAEGNFKQRLITGGKLDSPWGLAKVPDDSHFGQRDEDDLLVGNFGDGRINAYNVNSGKFLETLQHRDGQPLEFNGLWSLLFFHGDLYFTAGIVDEADGLFGFIHQEKGKDSDD
jgi:uncharacterized protein (TIGR03118 family)